MFQRGKLRNQQEIYNAFSSLYTEHLAGPGSNTAMIPALGRRRQEFKASPGYREPWFQKKSKTKNTWLEYTHIFTWSHGTQRYIHSSWCS
jgi:hypothetical protein